MVVLRFAGGSAVKAAEALREEGFQGTYFIHACLLMVTMTMMNLFTCTSDRNSGSKDSSRMYRCSVSQNNKRKIGNHIYRAETMFIASCEGLVKNAVISCNLSLLFLLPPFWLTLRQKQWKFDGNRNVNGRKMELFVDTSISTHRTFICVSVSVS